MMKIRVLHIIAGENVGGGERHLLTLCDRLDKEKFEVLIATTAKPDFLKEIKARGISLLTVEMDRKFSLSVFARLCLFIKNNRISIVHTHGARAGFYGRLSAKLSGAGFIVSTVHNSLYDYPVNILKKRLYLWLDSLTMSFCRKVICVSQSIACDLINRSRVKPEKVSVIHNGIDTQRFEHPSDASYLSKEFGIGEHNKKIGIVARLTHQKGHVYFIEALPSVIKEFPDIKCFFIGEGPEKDGLKRMLKQKALDSYCIFTGNRRDIPEFLHFIDLLILPSVSEGLPLILLEAMASGCPVLASRVSGIPEAVIDGVTGLLVDVKDTQRLSDMIISALRDRISANKRADAARKMVKEKFSAELMSKRVQEIYSLLCLDHNADK